MEADDVGADGDAGRVAITAISAAFAINDAESNRVMGFTVEKGTRGESSNLRHCAVGAGEFGTRSFV